MQTVITSKFQTTIPKIIREKLKRTVHDAIEWRVERVKIVLEPLQRNFLLHKNSIKTGPGNIDNDISLAKKIRAEKQK